MKNQHWRVLSSFFALAIGAQPPIAMAAEEEQISQTIIVQPGYFTKSRNPGCIGQRVPDPHARCEKVCVDVPRNAVISRVEFGLKEAYDANFIPVDIEMEALPWAKFAGQHTVDVLGKSQRICAMVKNWSGDRQRVGQIKVFFSRN